MKKNILLFIFSFLLFTISLSQNNCKAATKCIILDNGTKNSQYDITGDSKKDLVEVVNKDNCALYINGKQVFKPDTSANYLSVKLYSLNKKTIYFVISENYMETDDICGYSMYQYKSGNLEKLCDFFNPVVKNIYNIHYGVTIEKFSRNKVTVLCHNQFGGTGLLYWKMIYQCKNGKWYLKGNSYKITETAGENKELTAKIQINLYKKPGNKKILYTIKPGDKITINRIYIKNKKVYIQASDSQGTIGWFKVPEKIAEYFEEAAFPG